MSRAPTHGRAEGELMPLRGKTCVVTGATAGIGRATALGLAGLGADLFVLGRNECAGRRVMQRIRSGTHAGRAQFVRVDLSLPDDVRRAAAVVAAACRQVDVLINNAGARYDSYHETPDGFELTFATNHLGHFLLAHLLLDRLRSAAQGRVLTVSSGTHGLAAADGKWQLRPPAYDRRQAYAKSKLANILFAYELADRLRDANVTSNAVDPGGVASNFARNNGLASWIRHLIGQARTGELVSPSRAAVPIVRLASVPDMAEVTGKFFRHGQAVNSAPASYDRDLAKQLWQSSLAELGMDVERL